jgi:anti-sigma factor RsiW
MPADHIHSPAPEEIMEYVDGEGTATARSAIALHLASCAACQAIAAEQRAISEHARAWTVGSPPDSLRPPAPARVPAVPIGAGAWYRSRFVLVALPAAAVVLLVLSIPMRERRAVPMPEAIDRIQPARMRAAGRGGFAGGKAELSQAPATAAPALPQSVAARAGGPSVIRTATLRVVVKEFSAVRPAVEAIVAQAGGFIDQMTVTGDTATARELRGRLRVPGDRLTAVLARLRQIGQVVEDTQGSEDVTDQIVDLDARLVSARATEKRLTELLANRTGKLSDVLEVEREITRVRLDIERLDAEKTNMGRRVTYATIDISVAEERKAGLDAGPLPITTRIRIAAADGLESALETVALTVLFLLRAGPTLLLLSLAAGIAWMFGRRILKPGDAR